MVDVGLGQVCGLVRALGQSQRATTLHSCYNARPDRNLRVVVVADAQQRACMGSVNVGAFFVEGQDLALELVKRVFSDAAVSRDDYKKAKILVQQAGDARALGAQF